MALLSITDVSLAADDPELMRGFWLNEPEPGTEIRSFALTLNGWAVGSEGPVQYIEVSERGESVWALSLNLKRPELGEIYSDTSWAEESGFYHVVSSLKLPRTFELDLTAVTSKGAQVPMGSIRGTRSALSVAPARFRPVLVMSLGRMGSTWAATLLGQHPKIIAFRPQELEPRFLRYWKHVFAVLCEPASYRESLAADMHTEEWWMGTSRQLPPIPQLEPKIEQWLGDQYVTDLARSFKQRVDDFYYQVAELQGKEDARCFVEKGLPAVGEERLWPDLYPWAREIYLVRDFRDVACSMFSYRRASGFGRESTRSDEEFIRGPLSAAVHQLAHSWETQRARAHLLRYEDVILQPEPTLKSLFSFLDLEADDDVIAATLEQARSLAPHLQHEHQTSESAVRSIGRWRNDLSPSMLEACEEAFGEALELFGYNSAPRPRVPSRSRSRSQAR